MIKIVGIVIVAIFWLSCKKEGRVDFIDSSAAAPAQISNIKIIDSPGSALITYSIPKDPNLSYVKAVYETQPGVSREAKSSYYSDTLRLVGFGDTLTHEVKIYSVGKNEKASKPISVNVNPNIPPIQSVFRTLKMVSTFGGVQVSFENKSQANLEIDVLVDTTGTNTWSPINAFYTGASVGQFSTRGLDSTKKKFGVCIRDRWDNKSDTLIETISPLFEEEIPKNTWGILVLPTDQTATASANFTIDNLYDGLWATLGGTESYASANASTLPQWFTLDLGKKVSVSRIVEHQAPTSHLYVASAVKTFELWGSNNPNPDGSWASWDSLGTFHSFKPSGLPLGQTTDEDLNYGSVEGENFGFDNVLPPYRYLRWKTLETYSSTGQVVISELDVYGQIEP